jgi:collagen type III alpha
MTAPSPSAILGNPPVMNQPGPPMAPAPDPMAIFAGTDFMSSMPVLDGFDDASLSKTNFDVDFERDFGQWFNPENDVTGSLDPQ